MGGAGVGEQGATNMKKEKLPAKIQNWPAEYKTVYLFGLGSCCAVCVCVFVYTHT